MKKSTWLVIFAFLFGLLIGQPSISNASNTSSTGFTFCVNKKSGALRQLLKGSCTAKTENTLVMGAQGPQGVQGAVGPQGEPGVGTPFELLDANGNVITNVVDVNFYPDDPWSPLTFTRIIDKNAYQYQFTFNDDTIPTPVWMTPLSGGYFLDDSCTDGPYSYAPPQGVLPFAGPLENIILIPGEGWIWSNGRTTDGQVWGRYTSTLSVTHSAGDRYQLEGGSWVSDGHGNEGYVPPKCKYWETTNQSSEVWKLEQYPIPADLFIDFPVTVRWLP
jgi:hypothetical protein